MTAIPQIEVIGEVDDVSMLTDDMIETRPLLLLLDNHPPNEGAWTTLRAIKEQLPHLRCVVLVDSVEQQRMAEAAGADAVLLKGFPAAQLITTVESLLMHKVAGK